jgi:hypothetical protein
VIDEAPGRAERGEARSGSEKNAHELLAPGWFTKGFGTADLVSAKTLLDALR